MEENTDYGYTVDGISDIKMLVKDKAYLSPTSEIFAFKHDRSDARIGKNSGRSIA